MGKDIDTMSVEELESEAGLEVVDKVRKQVVEERLYEMYKKIGKR